MTEDNDLDLLSEDPLDRLLSSDIELLEDPQPINQLQQNVGIGNPAPAPEATPDNMVCMRGPCKYYLEIPAHFAAGNIGDYAFKMVNRFCLKVVPNENLTDSIVYDCNQWEPISTQTIAKRSRDRVKWLKANKKENW